MFSVHPNRVLCSLRGGLLFLVMTKSLFQCLFVIYLHLLIKKKVLLVLVHDLKYCVPRSFNQMCRHFDSWFLSTKSRKEEEEKIILGL